jgi:uncharacterized protein
MAKVYFMRCSRSEPRDAAELLKDLISGEGVHLEKEIPLKVHFGEEGNETYIRPAYYDGIIDYLDSKRVKTCFIETNVMYGGKRCRKSLHLETARKHGFTRIPVIIADGEFGEKYHEVKIKAKHFRSCKLGEGFSRHGQILVVSHFKGHRLAGFGGALKNLAMGFASRGGKLAMHMDIKPRIMNWKCKRCHVCEKHCAVGALHIGKSSYIDLQKCVGCAACTTACPHGAITVFSFKSIARMLGIGNPFHEKIAEYALAASQDRRHIYINFLMNITAGCDCEGHWMKPIVDDIGILASVDPVSLDQACFDLVVKQGRKFGGEKTFAHAEAIGVGSREYVLVNV